MTLTDERRKRLTEYLGLCWHEGRMPINCGYRCVKCGDTYVANRTFHTEADMMELYRAIHREGKSKSEDFMRFMMDRNPDKYYNFQYDYIQNFNGWLFCLSGEGYEERCKMVAEFYGWEDR
jgi:hypothetical protein